MRWHEGKVHYLTADGDEREVMYLHFMGFRRWWHWSFYRSGFEGHRQHVFSKIGYGGVTRPEQLLKIHWRFWYEAQSLMGRLKRSTGRCVRAVIPSNVFQKLRRAFGSNR